MKNENGDLPINATPFQDSDLGELYCDQTGLTKREYFAGLAMQGLLANGTPQNDATARSVYIADDLLRRLSEELDK